MQLFEQAAWNCRPSFFHVSCHTHVCGKLLNTEARSYQLDGLVNEGLTLPSRKTRIHPGEERGLDGPHNDLRSQWREPLG